MSADRQGPPVGRIPQWEKAQLIGINHVALEVDEIDQALDFYELLLDFEVRGRIGQKMAFLDAGDQFIALSTPRRQDRDDSRHFGLVVDDAQTVREDLQRERVEILPGRGLDFLDPWYKLARSPVPHIDSLPCVNH